MSDSYQGFQIQAAGEGGYYVTPISAIRGDYTPIIYAGTLAECLRFIEENILSRQHVAA